MFGTFITALTVGAVQPALAPDVVTGTYIVEGGCPGTAPYHGLITVEALADSFLLTWKIGEDSYEGSALASDGVLAISFLAAHQPGAMYMRRDKTGWEGKWAMTRSGVACREHWTPRG